MKNNLWVMITLVACFLGFLMGYSVPPFMEVAMSDATPGGPAGPSGAVNPDLMKQYQQLYETEK